jgi:hypothetical protein
MAFGVYQGAGTMHFTGVELGDEPYNIDDNGLDSGMNYANATSNYMILSNDHDLTGNERETDAEEVEDELADDPELERGWANTSPQIFDFITPPEQNQTRTQNHDDHNHQQQQIQEQSRGIHASGGSPLGDVPPRRSPQEFIPRTSFAPIYRSIFTLGLSSGNPKTRDQIMASLSHVNCSYLSSPDLAPTLLQLKQHTQALVILIKHLTISTLPAVIDNKNTEVQGANAFNDGETYDFLNDLNHAYEGPVNEAYKRHHNMPLTTLMNVLQQTTLNDHQGRISMTTVRDICPLHHAHKMPANGPSLPYATHQALISHANEVLELLDHEYCAKGGLLSILPPKEQNDDRAKAETTLLGQLILYMQRLVQRLHNLERLYANSMDALAGEAVVPHQALSRLGPDGRKGRELVYPQDRFVLVNAGEDLWQFLNTEFEKKEKVDATVDDNYRRMGATGEAIWEQRGGKEFARGITALDITTRYYRLRGDPLKTIFVIPAHAEHPGTKVTREMERQPTVVSVVKPIWPERASLWEMKNRADLAELKTVRRDIQVAQERVERQSHEVAALKLDNELKAGEVRHLRSQLQYLQDLANGTPAVTLSNAANAGKVIQLSQEVMQASEQLKEDQAAAKADRAAAALLRQDLERQIYELQASRQQAFTTNQTANAEILRRSDEADLVNAKQAAEIEDRLKKVWRKQIQDTQAIILYLKNKAVDVGSHTIPEEIRRIAKQNAEDFVKAALARASNDDSTVYDNSIDYIG